MARAARYSNRIDVGLFLGCALASLVVVVLPEERREPLAQSLRRTVVAPLVVLQSSAERWRIAWSDSRRRTLQRDTLAVQAFQVHALQRENDHLRRIIGLGRSLQWGFVPAEALHPTSREDIVTTLTLTAGANAGVERYNPVISPDGVVGYVQTVDPAISIAILFSHPDFRASAMSADGTAYGIVYPRLESDAENYLLELRGVPLRYDIKPGTLILTAGLGGTFPKGIPIGNVVREIGTPEVWTRTYLIQPAVNPTTVSAVIIMSAERAKRGAESVWKNVPSVDAAIRRMVAGGDSIARQDSLAAAAARAAAAIDSARRANPTATSGATTRPDSARPGGTPPPRGAAAGTPGGTRPRADSARAVRRQNPPADVVGPPSPPDTSATQRRDSARRDTTRPTPRPDTSRPATTPDSARPTSPVADSSRPTPRGSPR